MQFVLDTVDRIVVEVYKTMSTEIVCCAFNLIMNTSLNHAKKFHFLRIHSKKKKKI